MKNKFSDVQIAQNFQYWDDSLGRPVWARRTGSCTAISKGDKEHVFYPNDMIMAIGNQIHSIPLIEVKGSPKVVLLEGDKYWEELSLADATVAAALLNLNTYTTGVFIVNTKRGNK